MSSIALSINNLSFSYGKKLVLDNVCISVRQGQCTILLGPNGAGKSTLFALTTRLYDYRQGNISLSSYDIRKQTKQALAKLGVVFQQTTLDMDLTVLQNLRYHAALHGLSRKLAGLRIQAELERFNMYERRSETIRQLNGGHRRRVEIARALLHKPSVLLLDEPTVGLDVPSRKTIVEHVHSLASEQNLAVLWASHLVDEIFPTDQIVVVHQGIVKKAGTLDEILQQTLTTNINEAFDKLTVNGDKS